MTAASTHVDPGDTLAPSATRFVCATTGGHRVAFAIAVVQEVLSPRAITRLFHAPASLLGVVNLRGEILPVVDLLALLGGPPGAAQRSPLAEEARLIVLRAHVTADVGAQRGVVKSASIAVLVAHLDPLRDGAIEALPAGIPDDVSRVATGIVAGTSQAVLVIDPDKLVDVEELSRMRG